MSDDPIRARIKALLIAIAGWHASHLAGGEDEDAARHVVLDDAKSLAHLLRTNLPEAWGARPRSTTLAWRSRSEPRPRRNSGAARAPLAIRRGDGSFLRTPPPFLREAPGTFRFCLLQLPQNVLEC